MASVLYGLENVDFLHHLALSAFFLDLIFVCRFYSHQLTCQSMEAKIDLAKCALTQNLTDFVELNARFWHLVIFFEAVGDDLGQEGDLARPWTHPIRRLL